MLQTMDSQRFSFIESILNAESQEAVRDLINAAIKEWLDNSAEIGAINRQVDMAMNDLNQLNAMDHDFLQWSNIKMARIQFYQFKQSFTPVS